MADNLVGFAIALPTLRLMLVTLVPIKGNHKGLPLPHTSIVGAILYGCPFFKILLYAFIFLISTRAR